MAKIESAIKKIAPVKGYGVTGYTVEFSVNDLHKLNYLSHAVIDRCATMEYPEAKLAEFVAKLIGETIFQPESGWDCFDENGSAE